MLLCHGFPCALLGPFLWGHILLLPCLIILHHGPSVSTCFPISPASAQGCLSSHTSPELVYIENAHLQPEKSWRQQPPTLPSTLSLAPSIGLPHCLLTEACGLTCVCFSFANIRSPKFLGSSGSPGSGRTDTTILVGAQCSNTQSRGNRPPPPYWTQDSLTTGSLMTSALGSSPARGAGRSEVSVRTGRQARAKQWLHFLSTGPWLLLSRPLGSLKQNGSSALCMPLPQGASEQKRDHHHPSTLLNPPCTLGAESPQPTHLPGIKPPSISPVRGR